jgi:hypothetical protein
MTVPMPIHDGSTLAFALYTAAMLAITLGLFAWWGVSRERQRGPALPLLLIGGALSGLVEPFLDNVVLVWWPPEQPLAAFEAFGRTVPWFVPIGYAWFCGALLYFAARIYAAGVRPAQVWAIFAVVAVVDYVAIAATTWIGIMGFYGDPPMNVGGYPLWWAAIDGAHVMFGGAVVLLLAPRLRGFARLWLLAVPTIVIAASGGAVGWPISTALNSGWSAAGKWVAAAVTIGIGCAIVHLVAQAVSRPDHWLGFDPGTRWPRPAAASDSRSEAKNPRVAGLSRQT